MTEIKINLKKQIDDSYSISIDKEFYAEQLRSVIERMKPNKIAVISDDKVYGIYCDSIYEVFDRIFDIDRLLQLHFPAGEKYKNSDQIMQLFDWMADFGLDRKSLVVAFGGGVTGDMAGFLSAIYMRGIAFIQMPSSLLAMVDSSVGGKTGIDTTKGKNLIGSFYQPKKVIIDVSFLDTLAQFEFINGMAEVIKHAVIKDSDYFDFLEANQDKILNKSSDELIKMIEWSCRIKAAVVEQDEKEKGQRQILNYGHTIGHAIENASEYSISHGYAVALGMVAEAELSVTRGFLSKQDADRVRKLLADYGLLEYQKEIPALKKESLIQSAKLDKKNEKSQIKYVPIEAIGKTYLHEGNYSVSMTEDELIEAIKKI